MLTDNLTDEGWYTQNARNHYIFGEWVMDEHNPALVLTPLFTLFQRSMMSLLGVSFFSIRLVSAIFIILSVILIGLRLRNHFWWCFAALIGVSFNPYLYSYSRVAFVEPMQLGMIVFVWFFATSPGTKKINSFLFGLFAAFTVSVKPTAAVVVLMSIISPWIESPHTNIDSRLRRTGVVVLGGFIGLFLVCLFVMKYSDIFLLEFNRESTLIGGSGGYEGLATPLLLGLKPIENSFRVLPGYWLSFVPIFILGAARLLGNFGIQYSQKESLYGDQDRKIINITIVWIILGLLTFLIQNRIQYRPRYWLHLLVPVIILLTYKIDEGFYFVKKNGLLPLILTSLFISFVFRPFYIKILDLFMESTKTLYAMFLLIVLIVIGVVIFLPLIYFIHKYFMNKILFTNILFDSLLLITGIIWLSISASMLINTSFTIRDASRRIGEELGEDAVLTGSIANTMVTETNIFAYETRDLSTMSMGTGVLNNNPSQFNTTHVINTVRVENEIDEPHLPVEAELKPEFELYLVPDKKYPDGYRYKAIISRLVYPVK